MQLDNFDKTRIREIDMLVSRLKREPRRALKRITREWASDSGHLQRKKTWTLTEDEAAQHIVTTYDRDIKVLEKELELHRQALDPGSMQMGDYASQLNDIVFAFEKRIVGQAKTITRLRVIIDAQVEKLKWRRHALDELEAKITRLREMVDAYRLEHDDDAYHCVPPKDQCDCELCVETRVALTEAAGEN